MRILVTGAAGFIGFHLAQRIKKRGDFCLGLDNFNNYYDVKLKRDRAAILEKLDIPIITEDICQTEALHHLIEKNGITHVVHLAAQAGVRHSLSHPDAFVTANLQGFVSVLEACKKYPHIKIIYASSSSVYGKAKKIPFDVKDQTDCPTNLYGATKKANELIAHAYHNLYGMSLTALRYFTVFGPWGRPDMAYFRFAKNIYEGKPIQLFNGGEMKRDFTYIDDIVDGTLAAADLPPGYNIFNLGNNRSIDLHYLIALLEQGLGKKSIQEILPMQPGEIAETFADIQESQEKLKYAPRVSFEEGIARFLEWFKRYI